MTTVDLVLIGILAVAVSWGFMRGGLAFLTGMVAFLFASTIVGRYTDQIANFLGKTLGLEARLATAVGQQIGIPAMASDVPASAISQAEWAHVLANLPLPDHYKQALIAQIAKAASSASAAGLSAAQVIVDQLVQNILHGLAFFGGILVLGFGLSLAGRVLSGVLNKIPLVGLANRLLGAAIGLLGGVVTVMLIVAIVGPAMQISGSAWGAAIMNAKLAPAFLSIWKGFGSIFLGGGGQVWSV
ncbi:MAG TPA: hypothetical protein VK191_06640 [Symbiobacteriaceae bacterium]|nr:hypothetical protein [Symbiobacteriaceae bacterium]